MCRGDKLGVISVRIVQRMIGWYGVFCRALCLARSCLRSCVLRDIFVRENIFQPRARILCFARVPSRTSGGRTAFSPFFRTSRRRGSSSPCCANFFGQEPDLK
ncbi:unnamed protein product, partial [Ectocarpus sp. 12 AP-2014]